MNLRPVLFLFALFLAGLGLSGCSNMNTTEQRVLSGMAVGAGVGAATTVITGGCVSCGTVIGGAVGAGTGYVVDQMQRN